MSIAPEAISLEEKAVCGEKEKPEEKIDLSSLPLHDKITHANIQVRQTGFREILSELSANDDIYDQKTRQTLSQDSEIIFKEDDVETQKLILQIYTNYFLSSEQKFDNWDFNKKAFWYNFLNIYLCSTQIKIKETSWSFFEKLFFKMDKKRFLEICLDYIPKNNQKLSRTIYAIFNKYFHEIDIWESFIQKSIDILDKQISQANQELKTAAISLLKNLTLIGGIEITSKMKNLKPELQKEIKLFLDEKRHEQFYREKYPNLKIPSNSGKKSRSSKSKIIVDVYKISQSVSIIGKFNSNWFEETLNIKKWSEKKAAIDNLLIIGNVPKLQHTDNYYDLIIFAKKLFMDNNVQIQICGIKIFSILAQGLRSNGRNLLKSILETLVLKLKDKNSSIQTTLQDTLLNMLFAFTFEEIYDELKIYNKNRNRDIRYQILIFLKNVFNFIKRREDFKKSISVFLKHSAELLNIYYEDPDNEIRKETNNLVLFLMESLEVDASNLTFFNNKIDMKKVKNLRRQTSIDNKKRLNSKDLPKKTIINEQNRNILPNRQTMAKSDNIFNFPKILASDDIIAQIKDFVPEQIVHDIESQNTKIKENGVEQIIKYFSETNPEKIDSKMIRVVFGFLRLQFKDFAESNIRIVKLLFDLFKIVLDKEKSIEDLFNEFCKLFLRKINETKFKVAIHEIISKMTEIITFERILSYTLFHFDIVKQNPKALAELYDLFTQLSIQSCHNSLNELKSFISPGLCSSNQSTRISAQSFLKRIAPFITFEIAHSVIKTVESDVFRSVLEAEILPNVSQKIHKNPSFHQTTKSNSKKITNNNQHSQPLFQSNNLKISFAKSGDLSARNKPENSKKVQNQDVSLDSILQKSNNTQNLLKDIKSGLIKQDYKVRISSLEKYIEFLKQNQNSFSSTNVQETYQSLNLRMNDSHKSVALFALEKFKELLSEYFKNLKPLHKIIISSMLEFLNDKNVI